MGAVEKGDGIRACVRERGGVRKRVFTQAERPGEINLCRLKDQGGEFMDTEGSGEVIYAG